MIPHPAFRSDIERRDDGRTALLHGLIRPYKGVEDAVEAVLRVRTRACSSRAIRACRSRTSGGRRRPGGVAARIPPPRRDAARALGGNGRRSSRTSRRSTCPARSSSRSAPGSPRSSTTSAGSGSSSAGTAREPSSRRDVEGMAAALERLLSDADALAAARRGAETAREELTWENSAAAHLEALPGARVIFRRERFGDLVRRQLDLFETDEAELLAEAAGGGRGLVASGTRRRRRSSPATTSSSSTRSASGCTTSARRTRRRSTRTRPDEYRPAFDKGSS